MSLIYVSSQQLIKKRLHSNRRDANPVSSELWLCDVHRIKSCWRHFQFRRKSFFRTVDKILSRFKKLFDRMTKKVPRFISFPATLRRVFEFFGGLYYLKILLSQSHHGFAVPGTLNPDWCTSPTFAHETVIKIYPSLLLNIPINA